MIFQSRLANSFRPTSMFSSAIRLPDSIYNGKIATIRLSALIQRSNYFQTAETRKLRLLIGLLQGDFNSFIKYVLVRSGRREVVLRFIVAQRNVDEKSEISKKFDVCSYCMCNLVFHNLSPR